MSELPQQGNDVASAKQQLRDDLCRRRDAISRSAASAAASTAGGRVIGLVALEGASTVALYAPIRSEIDTEPLARAFLDRGVALAYPRVAGPRTLVFHRVEGPDDLCVGRWGIPEPPEDAPALLPGSLDVLVVPGLGFDARGGRLGWGKGYYDAALAEAAGAVRIGFAYDCQIIGDVPMLSTDELMSYVATERRILDCRANRGGRGAEG